MSVSTGESAAGPFSKVQSPAQAPVVADLDDGENENDNHEQDESQDESTQEDAATLKSELEKWKAEARKHEKRAKENAKAQRELQELRKGSLPEQDRMVQDAAETARNEARAEYGQRLASAEIRAALTGIVENPADIVEDLNLSRYVTDEGEVDEDAVSTLKQKYTALMGSKKTPKVGHGRSGKPPEAKTAADEFAETINGLLGRG